MASEGASSSKRRLSALLVEDIYFFEGILTTILGLYGFVTCAVKSVNQAVDLIRSGEQFDVIFLDMHHSVNEIEVS